MDRIFRIDMGDPAPELVFDPGGMSAPGSPARLLAYRLKDGVYRAIKANPELSAPVCPAFTSTVFGTHIRMQPWACQQDKVLSDLRSRFQWYDSARGFWRDPETDKRIRLRRSERKP